MKVKDLIDLLEGLTEADKESPLLAQVWDPEKGLSESYFEITSLSIIYEKVDYAKDGSTAKSAPPNVVLVHNPNLNNLEAVPDGATSNGQEQE
jgi:hypothetical protein